MNDSCPISEKRMVEAYGVKVGDSIKFTGNGPCDDHSVFAIGDTLTIDCIDGSNVPVCSNQSKKSSWFSLKTREWEKV